MQFHKGQRVLVRKPSLNGTFGISWVGGMDKYNNKIMTIRDIYPSDSRWYSLREAAYVWSGEWFSISKVDGVISPKIPELIMLNGVRL